jgi:hypothetical protein
MFLRSREFVCTVSFCFFVDRLVRNAKSTIVDYESIGTKRHLTVKLQQTIPRFLALNFSFP